MHKQRIALTLVWWVWGLALFAVLIAFSNQSAIFGEDMPTAWHWFLPNIVPTLMLVGAVSYKQWNETSIPESANKFWFGVAVVISIFYLATLTWALVDVLFVTDPISALQQANNWLAPLQGLAASALGVFFSGDTPASASQK